MENENKIDYDNINNKINRFRNKISTDEEIKNFVQLFVETGAPYDKEDLKKLLDSSVKISERQDIALRIMFRPLLPAVFFKIISPICGIDQYLRFHNLFENYTEKTNGDGDCFYWALVNILNLEKEYKNMYALKEALLDFYKDPKVKEAVGFLSEKENSSWVETPGGAILLAKFIKSENVGELLEKHGIKKGTYKLPKGPVIVFYRGINHIQENYYSSIIAYGNEKRECEAFPSLEEQRDAFRDGIVIVLDHNHYQNLDPKLDSKARQKFLYDFFSIELDQKFHNLEKCKDESELDDTLNGENIIEVLGEKNANALLLEIKVFRDGSFDKENLHETLEKYKNVAKEYIKEKYIKELIIKNDSKEILSKIKKKSPSERKTEKYNEKSKKDDKDNRYDS